MTAAGAALLREPAGEPDLSWTALRGVAVFRDAGDDVLRELTQAGLVHRVELPRDTLLEIPATMQGALCFVIAGQISIGVFDPLALAERGRQQRDAALGEK